MNRAAGVLSGRADHAGNTSAETLAAAPVVESRVRFERRELQMLFGASRRLVDRRRALATTVTRRVLRVLPLRHDIAKVRPDVSE